MADPPTPKQEFDDQNTAPAIGAAPPLSWVADHQTSAIILAFVLVLLYVAPIILVTIAYWTTDGFQEVTFWLNWFVVFVHSADSTLNEFHKILLPLMSALSVVVFKGRPDWRMLALGIFVLLAFVVTSFAGVLFDMKSIQTALTGLDLSQTPDPALIKTFFTRVQETLMMYLMMLFGIGVVNASQAK